jgi:hypothetical protein
LGDGVADRLITALPLVEHGCQHGHTAVHIVLDHDLFLLVMESVQSAHVLLNGSFP